MKITQLFREERAVSPVIGVILMVAITVILAAVIGTFVLNMGSSVSAAPTSNFDFEDTDTAVEITHAGGETLASENVEIRVGGSVVDSSNIDPSFSGNIGAGSTAAVNDSAVESGDVIQVVYLHPDSNKESVLGEFTVE